MAGGVFRAVIPGAAWGLGMKYLSLAIGASSLSRYPRARAAWPTRTAAPTTRTSCSTNPHRNLKSLGKLRCGEQVEVVARNDDYTEVQTEDGRIGWVINGDLSASAPAPQEVYTFGLTEKRKAEPTRKRKSPTNSW